MKKRQDPTESTRKETAADRLSVVVPTLGRETVVRTVETLLAAHGGDRLEIVVAGKIADPAVKGALGKLMRAHGNIKHLEVQFETGDTSLKKNEGVKETTREFIAFVDDDVEVAEDWPDKILTPFEDSRVGLASGPGLVPDALNEVGRQAGLALSSRAAGYVAQRYLGGGEKTYPAGWDDIIGCNQVYRRRAFAEMGGFPADCIPGEEMLAAFRTQRLGWNIRFVPGARVWHWPRQSLGRFWRQMWRYGAARIRLMRMGADWHWAPLVPGLWVGVTVVLAVAGAWWRWAWALLGLDLLAYSLVAVVFTAEMMRATKRWRDWHLWPMLWVMHVAYGLGQWLEIFCPARDLTDPPVVAVATAKVSVTEKPRHGT